MSVYTTISEQDLEAFLAQYSVGSLKSYKGISEGIENTNYFVDTDQDRFVLTIFENHTFEELPYFMDVMAFLHEHNIPGAHPIRANDGQFLLTLQGKPAALVNRLQGGGISGEPSLAQCGVLAETLGQMHLAGANFGGRRANDRDLDWMQETADLVGSFLNDAQSELLHNELTYQLKLDHSHLPQGVIHADLFRDNALFDGDNLAGLIDFYYACHGHWLYDLAVTVNDWCRCEDGSIDETRYLMIVESYQRIREVTHEEQSLWNKILRLGALRFWLSRLKDKHLPKEGDLTHIKDPAEFENLLRFHRETPLVL